MATELKKLTVDASNGSYTFEVVDAEARETANAAKTAAEGISIPSALPNPNKLIFTGGATGEYDGSMPVTINIPTGGEGGGSGPIQYIESLDESNLANLRDLETGTYVLYGYFYPFAGAADTLTCDNTLVSVAHLSAGSHVLVFNPLNCKVNFVEILVDESAEGGHTYTVDLIDMRDLNTLIAMVGDLEGLSTTEKTSLVAAINEVAANQDSGGNANLTGVVKSVNGVTPDENGNVTVETSGATDEQVATSVAKYLEDNPVNGLSEEASNLLIEILESAVYNANVTGKIASLKEALGYSGDDSGSGDDDTGGEETVTDDITVENGVMTIISVGSEITVSDGVMTIA